MGRSRVASPPARMATGIWESERFMAFLINQKQKKCNAVSRESFSEMQGVIRVAKVVGSKLFPTNDGLGLGSNLSNRPKMYLGQA